MKSKSTILSASLLTILLCTVLVSAAWAYSVTYLKFNSTQRTDYTTGETAESWTLEIKNHLSFNTTGTPYAKIYIANSSSTGYYAISINLAKEGTKYSMDVYVPTKVDPGANDWAWVKMIHNCEYDQPYYVSLSKEGKLSVGNATNMKGYVEAFYFGTMPAKFIGVQGSTAYVATSGYVDFVLGEYKVGFSTTDLTTTLTAVLAAVLPLVIVMKIFEKIFKKAKI